MRELLRTIRDYDAHLMIYPRLTRDGVIYRMSVRLYGDRHEICHAMAASPDEFETGARYLVVEFHKQAEQLDLDPVY